ERAPHADALHLGGDCEIHKVSMRALGRALVAPPIPKADKPSLVVCGDDRCVTGSCARSGHLLWQVERRAVGYFGTLPLQRARLDRGRIRHKTDHLRTVADAGHIGQRYRPASNVVALAGLGIVAMLLVTGPSLIVLGHRADRRRVPGDL